MRDSIFTGAGVALVTPFHENGKVNYEKFQNIPVGGTGKTLDLLAKIK